MLRSVVRNASVLACLLTYFAVLKKVFVCVFKLTLALCIDTHIGASSDKLEEQAGAELCQAQVQLH